ncbi:glycerophosphoryl diester phosphodiesterase membrane domain-containing protein [Erythrobacteraceae bacterium E2-1 Yellow Sea]|nr:glycerophosphoryl diester phosphodiesterase membrane domain-containing protein [Erythrobacteraceae bacterium E2-1 Yellow Sea]
MKLDMGRAWSDATALLAGNRNVVMVVAGVFFFLPYFAIMLLVPETMQPQAQMGADPADMEQAMQMLGQLYAQNWWVFVVIGVTQAIGMLALMTLLTDRNRPTVGEAIARGGRGFFSYIGTQILFALALGIVIALLVALGAAIAGPQGAVLTGVIAFVIGVYLFIKFSLVTPVIAIDGILNPIRILQRSWQLTKGNSFRLLGFYILLFLALGIVSGVVTMVMGVLFAAMGGQLELIGNGLFAALLNAVFVVIFLGVLAGVHRQLSGPSQADISDTFE